MVFSVQSPSRAKNSSRNSDSLSSHRSPLSSHRSSWSTIQDRVRNSVIHLTVVKASRSIVAPYRQPNYDTSTGSGFFIDAVRGIFMSNAHVLNNALSIVGRIPLTGKLELRIKLIGICKEKDLGIGQIYQEDLSQIRKQLSILDSSKRESNLSILDLPFGDNFELKETDEVMAVGYPLGEEAIKFTLGNVSGFSPNDDGDDGEESPTYIQITAPLNPGNSGGPLINTRGEVVGINAAGERFMNNIGYAIPSRSLLSMTGSILRGVEEAPILNGETPLIIPNEMKDTPLIVRTPRTSFEWVESNEDLIQGIAPKGTQGVYVTRVYPDSNLLPLGAKDLLTHIQADITLDCELLPFVDCKRVVVQGPIDNYGDVSVIGFQRKLALKEILDVIPEGNQLTFHVWRENNPHQLQVSFTRSNKATPLKRHSTYYEPIKYQIIAGLCITPLTMNLVHMDPDLEEYANGMKKYQPHLVVTQILPGTEASRIRSLNPGMVIDTVNDHEVRILEELRLAIQQDNTHFKLKTKEEKVYKVSLSQANREDVAISSALEISSLQG